MNKEISIAHLVNLIAQTMNVDVSIISDDLRIRPTKSEVDRLLCDNSELLSNTNWIPKYTLKEGIEKVIDWMKIPENLKHYKSQYNV